MKLDFLRIRNLRSLAETQEIELRPITVLVGVNSSGKSTFLRAFPLLRQSVETITTGPILWYGRYVDFGTFAQAVRKSASPQEITFQFGLKLSKNYAEGGAWYGSGLRILDELSVALSLSLVRREDDGKTVARRVEIDCAGIKVVLEANIDGTISSFRLNDKILPEGESFRFVPSENLLPHLVVKAEIASEQKVQQESRRYPWTGPFENPIRNAFNSLLSNRAGSRRTLELSRMMALGSDVAQLSQLKSFASGGWGGSVFARRVAALKTTDSIFLGIRNAVVLNSLPQLLVEIDTTLANLFRAVRYIAPIRATAERYYRQQDLAVDEVDPQGANLAMFLRSLSWRETRDFSEWCRQQFGFSVEATTEGAHTSLVLQDASASVVYNIADMGFGFSQILPVLAQIWSLNRENKRTALQTGRRHFYYREVERERIGDIVAIEQPELHLHPRLQARVADMFVAAIDASKKIKRPLTIVFETHSETIINRIGLLVAEGRLAPTDVHVLVFEKGAEDRDTKVKTATFGSDGILKNWPSGFFLSVPDEGVPSTVTT